MKRLLFLVLAMLALTPAMMAEDKKKKKEDKSDTVKEDKIQWLNWADAQEKMKKKPKKVLVDVYTDWCGWCKRMDATTFSNKELIKYVNKNFYAIKFNSEKEDSIRFLGKMYYISPEGGANQLAIDLMNQRLSYPTFIIMEENFQNPQPVPGYQPVEQMELVLTYLGDNIYKTTKFAEFQQTYSPGWSKESN